MGGTFSFTSQPPTKAREGATILLEGEFNIIAPETTEVVINVDGNEIFRESLDCPAPPCTLSFSQQITMLGQDIVIDITGTNITGDPPELEDSRTWNVGIQSQINIIIPLILVAAVGLLITIFLTNKEE